MKKFVIILALVFSLNSHATMLIKAVKNNNTAVVKSLVLLGADVNKKDKTQTTPLIEAAVQGNTKIASILLKAGAEVDLADSMTGTPLSYAVFKQKVPMVDLLLEYQADPNLADGAGKTPLLVACLSTTEEASIVKSLLKAGANPNLADIMKRTPLMAAAFSNQLTTFNMLIENGANIHARDKGQKSVLSYAAENESFKNILLKKGVVPYRIEELNFLWDIKFTKENLENFKAYRNDLGENHLIMAIKSHQSLAIAPLLEMGFNANVQDKEGKAAIHWAAIENDLEAVLELIKAKAKLKIVDKDGTTALEYAVLAGNVEVAAILAIAILNEELE